MKMFMTDGMFGRYLEQVGTEFKTFQEAMLELQDWKDSEMNGNTYKIEPYDRFVFNEDRNEIAIDFGDYSTFMLVTDCGKKDAETYFEKTEDGK